MSDELKVVIGFVIGVVIWLIILGCVLYLGAGNYNSFKEECIENNGIFIEGNGFFSQDQCIYKVDKE